MRYALVNSDGLVVNAVEWDGGKKWTPPEGLTAVQSEVAGAGWSTLDGVLVPPPIPVGTPPPIAVTALQARRAMRAAGLFDLVKTAVYASQNNDVVDTWEVEPIWHRDNAWINTLATQLGLTSKQVDTLFEQAKLL